MMESGRNPSSVGLVRRTPSPVLGNFGDDHSGFLETMYSGFHKAGSWSLPLSLCLCPEIGGCHRMIEEVVVGPVCCAARGYFANR
jgi:hypothetical protein